MQIDTHDMTSALYTQDLRSLDEQSRVTIWAHVQSIVADLTESASPARHADAMRLAPTLKFDKMSPEVKAMFHIALEQMPSAKKNLLMKQVKEIMAQEPLTTPLKVRENPHGLNMRYHKMNVQV